MMASMKAREVSLGALGLAVAWVAWGATGWAQAAPPPLHVDHGVLADPAGQRVVLYGVNLFESHLMWSRRQDPGDYERELPQMASCGFNAIRMPLNMAWFEPREGVFPDHPDYAAELKAHGLPTNAIAFYDGLVRRAGELGLYVIPEFHELPWDPYRYFVGGDEADRKAGRPGQAIAWLASTQGTARPAANWDLVQRELPKALAWMAGHWKGMPAIAGIEIPWNEPSGPLTEGPAYLRLCRDCARAVKQADPARLVMMDAVDWGAMVNTMPDESVWRLPEEVDVLFPHFYPGLHSGNSAADGTWRATMANWASWMAGSGKPVMVGEFGVVEMGRAGYWKSGVDDTARAATLAACAAQWHAMGVDGVFCWAWKKGIGSALAHGVLNEGAAELPKWSAPYRANTQALAHAAVGIVWDPRKRSAYGDRKDLWAVSDALLGAHLTPFATVFTSQVAEQPGVLGRFKVLLVPESGLPDNVSAAVAAAGIPVVRVKDDGSNLGDVVREAARHVTPAGDWPDHVLVGVAPGRLTVFERAGREGPVTLRVAWPGISGRGALASPGEAPVFRGDAAALERDGVTIRLGARQCVTLAWTPEQIAKP